MAITVTQKDTGGFGMGPFGSLPFGSHFVFSGGAQAIDGPALELAYEDRTMEITYANEALEFAYDDKIRVLK